MHTVFALLCIVVVIHWLIFPYPSGLLHWHCGNLTIAPVPTKQPWWIWINTSCEFIMNDCITTTKQSTTKPCAYFLGYTVYQFTVIFLKMYESSDYWQQSNLNPIQIWTHQLAKMSHRTDKKPPHTSQKAVGVNCQYSKENWLYWDCMRPMTSQFKISSIACTGNLSGFNFLYIYILNIKYDSIDQAISSSRNLAQYCGTWSINHQVCGIAYMLRKPIAWYWAMSACKQKCIDIFHSLVCVFRVLTIKCMP